ncbi:pyroglutamyl-peptidase I family protein [Rothia terrae]|uniref:Pyroglutamyl-peptidase I n=1 Tax=Rothia terrae TaxID=396015 RepID=A0A7H2BFI1_9MICC|nr:pyroglutamyl-peptidase I [Rothia terrae]QNV38427.1 pyroglutamyl-peptidase I [Rothia terrae]
MKKLLITYFGAFEGVEKNPTQEIAQNVRDLLSETHPHTQVVLTELPVSFAGSTRELEAVLQREKPDAVLSLGVAVGRDKVSLERVAINLDDARIADNDGVESCDQPIRVDGPVAYFSRLPYRELFTSMKDSQLPVEISDTAGTFVCNHVFYELMHALEPTDIPGGFVHIPATRDDDQTSHTAEGMTAHADAGGAEGREIPALPVSTVSDIVACVARALVEL